LVDANTDGLRLLWILVRAVWRGVDDVEAALADARHAHSEIGAWLAEADKLASIESDDAALPARERLAADVIPTIPRDLTRGNRLRRRATHSDPGRIRSLCR
jgi:hypothetical protein